ncbi:MAG: NAD(+) diphosphatase [Pseudomonadota bacterium]
MAVPSESLDRVLHTFAGNPLDRADAKRRDESWLADAAAAHDSRYLLLWNLNVLTIAGEAGPRLGWLEGRDVNALGVEVPPIFLGIMDETPHFALDVSRVHDPMHELNLTAPWQFDDARRAAMGLPNAESGILAQARSQVDWHHRHGFCSVCGGRTTQFKGGHVRRCNDCGADHFPRTDPVAIMLIVDGDQCLLGQSAGRLARTGMYSALAGFIDQGESIEAAVRREVMEEAGIEVGAVSYHSSQPWPFPSSLMIGCHGQALTREINMDTEEMADVRFFHRDEVTEAMTRVLAGAAGGPEDLKVPGSIAIAHHLIRAWVDGEVHFN